MKTLKQFREAAEGYRKVKSPDEQKFVDKHEVETVADANGNGDEVFKASNVKKVDRKKDRKGYEPGEDEKVYEGVKAYDKSGKLVGHYPDMKTAQKLKPGHRHVVALTKGWGDGGKSMKTSYGKLNKEETEQVDEMSSKMKMKLGLYNKKKKEIKEEADRLIERYTQFKESIEGLSPRLQETMHDVHDRLSEENRDKFVAACQTEEGLEKMIAFAIENRGE